MTHPPSVPHGYTEEMDEQRWQVYRTLGLTFTAIGLGGVTLSIAERVFQFRFFSSSAIVMSLLILGIGLLLLQTVRQGRREAREREAEAGPGDI